MANCHRTTFLTISANAEVTRSVRFVCHSARVQDYCKRNQPNSLKLIGVVIWLTNRKNLLTFGSDPVPDTDSTSTSLAIAIQGILGDLLAFLIVTDQFSRHPAND